MKNRGNPIFMPPRLREPWPEALFLQFVRLSVCPSIKLQYIHPFTWTWYLTITLWEFLQIWHKHLLRLKDELIMFWWLQVTVTSHLSLFSRMRYLRNHKLWRDSAATHSEVKETTDMIFLCLEKLQHLFTNSLKRLRYQDFPRQQHRGWSHFWIALHREATHTGISE